MQLMKIFHHLFVLLQLCVFRVFREGVDNHSCQSDSALDNRQQVQKHRSEVETPLHLIHNKHDTFLLDGDLPQFTSCWKDKNKKPVAASLSNAYYIKAAIPLLDFRGCCWSQRKESERERGYCDSCDSIFREINWTTNLNQTGFHCLIRLQPFNCKGHFEKNVWRTNTSCSLKKSGWNGKQTMVGY